MPDIHLSTGERHTLLALLLNLEIDKQRDSLPVGDDVRPHQLSRRFDRERPPGLSRRYLTGWRILVSFDRRSRARQDRQGDDRTKTCQGLFKEISFFHSNPEDRKS